MAMRREIRVGLFVLVGLFVAGVVIFLIGDEKSLFDSKVSYHAVFTDVQGLKPGSPVRMGGVDIGSVKRVGYGSDPTDTRLHVTLEIVKAQSSRIRKNSVVRVANKGLLGDKMVEVTVGDPTLAAIDPDGVIPSEEGNDFTQIIDQLQVVGAKAEAVMRNLEKTTGTFADEKFRSDMQQSMHSMSSILKTVDEGDGYVSRLLRDEKEAQKLSATMSNLERTTARLDQTLASINQAVHRVNHGPGFAHDVIYGDGPSQTMAQFGRAADEVALTLKGVREGNGLAKSVLYGDEGSEQMVQNLTDMSRDMKEIVAQVRAGKGTLGALLVDPSVYEDLKLLLGNVERNKALRALVRYSISRDEKVEPVRIVDPEKPGRAEVAGDEPAPR